MATGIGEAVRPFEFKTKAQNLQQLDGRLRHSRICELLIVTVGEWQQDPATCITQIRHQFAPADIIVRSSATDEDTAEASFAGAFDSRTGVDSTRDDSIADAIDFVIGSYVAKDVQDLRIQEVLVQPMVADVVRSGVVFTRDLERNLPYFVVNYEESDRTDSITGGTTSAAQRTYRIFKGAELSPLPAPLDAIVSAVTEVENLTCSQALDIEFAMDGSGAFYLLQVRPLVQTQIVSTAHLDRRLGGQVAAMTELVERKLRPLPGLAGATTILGEMPDWNPAEIIGTRPTLLASSLYRYLIMNSVWREARGLLGYRDPSPHQLLVSVAGRPYVDVRCSFNSLVPSGISEQLAGKLVDYYIERLRQNPHFHDKVEFEVVFSSHTFDTAEGTHLLAASGFSDSEVATVWRELLHLTNDIVESSDLRSESFEHDVAAMAERRHSLLAVNYRIADIPFLVEQLLEDCRRFGTLPFSVAARCAFVAMSFLRSMVVRGVLTEEAFHRYTNSIDTVASSLVRDLDLLRDSDITLEKFLSDYGHLRPGTYDIRAFSYNDRPDEYLTLADGPRDVGVGESPTLDQSVGGLRLDHVVDPQALRSLIDEFDFSFDIESLDSFIKVSIREREWLKLEFSKNLSSALDLMAEFGRYHGVNRDEMAFLQIDEFLRFANESLALEELVSLKQSIERRRKLYELTSILPLPDLIADVDDVIVVSDQRRKPNFVTQQSITAELVVLTSASDIPADSTLSGKVILIENADPGYDWLFSKNIAGLCTKYGGAASHMTIRCAEFGTPAAIGCGEQIYSRLRQAGAIRLDCQQQVVEPHGG